MLTFALLLMLKENILYIYVYVNKNIADELCMYTKTYFLNLSRNSE